MKGYYKEPEATAGISRRLVSQRRFGVMHPDGYIALRDRLRDIIVVGAREFLPPKSRDPRPASGGGSSAVVAMPHENWGNPQAFVVLQEGVRVKDQAT